MEFHRSKKALESDLYWKIVYILISGFWNEKKFLNFSKSYDSVDFPEANPGYQLGKLKKKIPEIKIYTLFQHKSEGKIVSTPKTKPQHIFTFVGFHLGHPVYTDIQFYLEAKLNSSNF